MQLRNLIQEDRAVSPVIGVILMVAITVILAAVIGTFVLGLGDSLQDTSPQASFGFDYGDAPNSGGVTISHEGGDSIDGALVSVSINGNTAYDPWGGTINAGSSVTIDHFDGSTDADESYDYAAAADSEAGSWSGENIRVVWTSNDGSSSQTIASSTAPSN